jgi:hypothetical protein
MFHATFWKGVKQKEEKRIRAEHSRSGAVWTTVPERDGHGLGRSYNRVEE